MTSPPALRAHPPSAVLLTGASGVLGQALIPHLGDHALVGLTHRRSPGPGVEWVRADLSRPRLGLDAHRYADLAGRADVIVHCAATTHFGAGAARTDELNVAGTARVLELAAAADAAFYYVSTAFVSRTSRPDETASARPGDYLRSKRAAESLVRSRGRPAVIVRPSVIIGDSRDGRIARFQGLHAMLRAVLTGGIPFIPLRPDTLVDFLPQDLVARTIAGLIAGRVTSGEYWVTAGAEALTAEEMVETCVRFGHRAGLRPHRPRLMAPEVMTRLVRPVFIDPLPEGVRRRFDDLAALTALFDAAHPFPTSVGTVGGTPAPTRARLRSALVASLRYLARVEKLAVAGATA